MATRLVDRVEEQERQEITPRRRVSAVTKITSESPEKDKQISAKVNEKVYKAFTEINKAQGLSNNSALNMIINKYVRDNKGLLDVES